MKTKIILLITTLLLMIFITIAFPIVKLMASDTKVTKAIFTETYYVNINYNENEIDVVSHYLKSQGWIEDEDKRMGGLLVFQKDGKEKHIVNNNIKTILVEGKLNL